MGRSTTPKIKKKTKKDRQCSKRTRTFSSEDNDEFATVVDEKRPDLCKSTNSTDLNGNIPTQIHTCGGIGTYIDRSYIPRFLVKWIVLSICIFLLNVCISCIISLVVYYVNKEFALESQSGVNLKNIFNVIIPCDDMSLSKDEDDDTFDITKPGFKYYVDDTGRSICYFENLTAVIDKATERESRRTLAKGLSEQRYQSCGNVVKAPASGYLTAYFTRLSIHKNHTDRGNDYLVHWDNRKLHSYIGPGITYHNGKIRVNVTQDYFVYAFVTSDQGIGLDGKGHPGSCLFTMWVFKGPAKYDGEFERIQLKSTQMLRNTTISRITSYVGSQVHLYSNEEIYVKVTDSTRLVHTPFANGFGIFPLL